jgi:hypothetical protein
MSPGRYWIFFRPRRMTWIRWLKLATARLASTPRLSADQMPSTGFTADAYAGSRNTLTQAWAPVKARNQPHR